MVRQGAGVSRSGGACGRQGRVRRGGLACREGAGRQRQRCASDHGWIAEITGLGVRTINKAVAALVEIGMLKRNGNKISIPSYAKEP